MATVNIGIIGAGRIGKVHAENLTFRIPAARVVSICDVNLAAARALADQLGIPTVCDDYHTAAGDPAVDAILVCSSTDTHADVIEAAAGAGKHIFTEKPIELNLGRIDEVLRAVERADVKFQVGFNRRFDPTFARVREAVQSGEVGEPHLLHVISRDPSPPPPEYVSVSGGIFLDMTIHDFDMARFLVGSEVSEVYARGAVRIDPRIGEAGDVDTAMVMLTFENGVIGTIDNSRQAVYGYDQRVEVLGSRGGISTANLYPNQVTFSSAKAVYRDLPLNFFMERYTTSYVNEIQDFISAIVDDRPPQPTGLDGRMSVAVGLAAKRSLREGRPVKVSEIVSGSG